MRIYNKDDWHMYRKRLEKKRDAERPEDYLSKRELKRYRRIWKNGKLGLDKPFPKLQRAYNPDLDGPIRGK